MATFDQQLPVLIGVVVGALASYLASAAMERTRWRRQQSARWDERRAQVYADYGYAVKMVYMQCIRIVENSGFGVRAEPTVTDALSELHRLTNERTAKWESVLLLGSPDTVAAARTWHRLLWHMELFALGERTDTREWATLRQEIDDARADFYEAARRDLGIRTGPLPSATPWEAPSVQPTRGNESPEVSADAG